MHWIPKKSDSSSNNSIVVPSIIAVAVIPSLSSSRQATAAVIVVALKHKHTILFILSLLSNINLRFRLKCYVLLTGTPGFDHAVIISADINDFDHAVMTLE